MSKKIISVLLAVVMVLAMGTVALVSVSADLASLPEQPADTYRYYFYMPDQWVNDYVYTAGIYWWEGTDAHSSWPGIAANEADVEGVYYYDVPTDVSMIIWNNFVDGGQDPSLDIYKAAVQTKNIPCEYYDAGENDLYPDGTDSFDGMIYVTDCEQIEFDSYGGKMTYGGEWYYYYGDGKYGTAENEADAEVVYTEPAFNLDKFQEDPGSGQVTEAPTEAPTTVPVTEAPTTVPVTEAPTPAPTEEPTEAPTTAPVVEYGKVVVGEEAYGVTVDDVITYTYTLTTPANIENAQATTYYDAEKLELVAGTAKEMFPVLRDITSVVYNTDIPGEVKFNATEGVETGFDFTQGGVLVTLTFKVLDNSADSYIYTTVEEMVQFGGGDYATGGVIVADGVVGVETLTGNTVPENPTEAPTTVPATDAPTTAPVTDAPATDAPTTAPADSTDAPTAGTDPTSKTDAPVDPDVQPPVTGAAAYIYVVVAVLAMAACAVVVLRKRVNG